MDERKHHWQKLEEDRYTREKALKAELERRRKPKTTLGKMKMVEERGA